MFAEFDRIVSVYLFVINTYSQFCVFMYSTRCSIFMPSERKARREPSYPNTVQYTLLNARRVLCIRGTRGKEAENRGFVLKFALRNQPCSWPDRPTGSAYPAD